MQLTCLQDSAEFPSFSFYSPGLQAAVEENRGLSG